MQRHITDQPKPRSDASRLKAFLTVARQDMPNPASLALHRKATLRGTAKVTRFIAIEKGERA